MAKYICLKFVQTIAACQQYHAQIVNTRHDTGRPALHLVDDLSNELCLFADMAECCRLLHEEPQWKEAAEQCVALIGEQVSAFDMRVLMIEPRSL